MMVFQPRNPVAFLPGSDVYMDNWCDIKCRKGPNGSKYFFGLRNILGTVQTDAYLVLGPNQK